MVQTLSINGVKSDTMLKSIKSNLTLKVGHHLMNLFKEDLKNKNFLREQGYFFSEVSASIENLEDNKINLSYNVLLGSKSKIKNIVFTGNKIFKNKKLRSVIVSEEYKFWKFISGKNI